MKRYSKQIAALVAVMPWYNEAHAQGTGMTGGVSDMTMLVFLLGFGILMLIVVLVLANIIKGLTANKGIWKFQQPGKKGSAAVITALMALTTTGAYAQDAGATSGSFVMSDTLFYALLTLDIFLVCVVFYLFSIVKKLVAMLKAKDAEAAEAVEEETVFELWAAKLTDAVPVEREEEVMTEHVYDGIRELDNNLPPWWVWGFYLTILFAAVYLVYYHVLDGPSSTEEYMAEMRRAEEKKEALMAKADKEVVDENTVTVLTSESQLAIGEKIYNSSCATCHGNMGEGGTGPNLTDQYWLHGGGIKNVFSTIQKGVPTTAMIPWETQMSPSQIQQVASYVLSLQGTDPPNAKEPEGEKYVPEEAAPADTTAGDEKEEPAEVAMK